MKRAPFAQRGVSLLFALLVLVILGFATIALTRSVDTSTLIMGNLGFQQSAVNASDNGGDVATAWLDANFGTLDADRAGGGYYATSYDRLDPTGQNTSAANKLVLVDWNGDGCAGIDASTYQSCSVVPFPSQVVNGNTVQYVITRMCAQPGPDSGVNQCLRPATVATTAAAEQGELSGGGRISSPPPSPYYRIVVRVAGPRRTVSFTETFINF